MNIDQFFSIVVGIGGTILLASLSFYIYLAFSGNSFILYSATEEKLGSPLLKGFHLFAAIALLICMYQGAYSMLGWIPENSGSFGEDGKFKNYREIVSSLFAFVAGFTLVAFIGIKASEDFANNRIKIECAELKKIAWSPSPHLVLHQLIKGYKEEISRLEKLRTYKKFGSGSLACWLPESKLISMYCGLIKIAEYRISFEKEL